MFDAARSNSAVLCRNLRTWATSMPNIPFAWRCRTMAEKFLLYVTLITRYANYLWIKMFDVARSNSAVQFTNLWTWATSMPNIPFASKCRTMAEKFLMYVTLIWRPVEYQREWQEHWGVQIKFLIPTAMPAPWTAMPAQSGAYCGLARINRWLHTVPWIPTKPRTSAEWSIWHTLTTKNVLGPGRSPSYDVII